MNLFFPSGEAADRPRSRPVGRWVAGLAVAAVVHAVLAVAVLGMAPPARFKDLPEGGGGPLMMAGLYDADGAAQADAAPASAASPLDRMLDSLATPGAVAARGAAGASPGGSAMSELFGDAAASPGGGGATAGGARVSAASAAAKPGFDYGAQASVGRRRPASGGGPVGPCWGRPERPVPVVMAVLLDEDGGLVGRPRIISSGLGAGDPRAAEYERTAMRAMAGCAPFSLAPPGIYEAYRIDFSREKGLLIRLGPMASP